MIVIFFMLLIIILIFFINTNNLHSLRDPVEIKKDQLREEINKLFSEENVIIIYPRTKYIEIKQGDTDGIGLKIKNLQEDYVRETTFSYSVYASDITNCRVNEEVAESWIVSGKAEEDIAIPIGGSIVRKVMFQTSIGSPLCIARYKLEVRAGGNVYAIDFFDVRIK